MTTTNCILGGSTPRMRFGFVGGALMFSATVSPGCGGDVTEVDTLFDGSSSSSGDPSSDDEGPNTTGVSAGTGGASAGSGDGEGTGTGCSSHDACPEHAPLCEDGTCVPCDSVADPVAGCSERSVDAPACSDAGQCVSCTDHDIGACEGETPLCNSEFACVGCTFHPQCPDSACDVGTGACLPPDVVLSVPDDAPSIHAAVGMIAPGSRGTIVVHGNTDRDEAIRIDGGRSVAIVRPWGSTWTWRQSQIQAPTLDVVGENTRVYLQNITLVQNNFHVGVRVVGATVVLDETRVIKHEGGGVLVEDQGELLARNAFIGQDHNAVDAVRINGGAATIVSSTLAGGGFNAAALSCNVFDAVQVRNAILVTRGGTASDEVVCSGADITFTATEGQRQGEGNVAVGEFPSASPTQWFADVANGDYHLTGAGLTAFAGVAHWTPDDPRWDIDGEDRPTLPRTPDFAGADVP